MKEEQFKLTDIGLIPKDWACLPLGNIGSVKMCRRVMKHQTSEFGDVPFFKIGTFGNRPDAYISRSLFDRLRNKYSYPTPGTILISAAGTIGRTVIFGGEDSYFQDSNIVWIDNPQEIVTNMYLYYYYSIAKWQTENGGIVVRLYNDNLLSTKIACPSIQEQERITDALSDIDKLIKSLKSAILKKSRIREGAVRELLTGETRINGYSGKWLAKNLGESATIKARIGWQGLTTNEYLDSGDYYLITGTDFSDGGIAWEGCHYVSKDRYEQDPYIKIKEKDVLVTKDGTIGKVAYLDHIPGPGTLNSGVFVIRTNDRELSQRYLSKVFISKYFDAFIDSIVAGSTIIHLYQKDIVKFNFQVPPSIDEQDAICNVIEDMDNDIRSLKKKLNKYLKIRSGMKQQLLTGKIRLTL